MTDRTTISPVAPFIPPKKKPGIFWWIGGVFLLLVCLFLYQLFGPNPRIVVSPQTTYITQPLMDDGLPNYEQYTLERLRTDITPENNAAVLLWNAVGPCDLNAAKCEAIAKELRVDFVPSKDDALIATRNRANVAQVAEWLKQRATTSPPRAIESATSPDDAENAASATSPDVDFEDLADEVITNAAKRTWTSDQIPPLAKWVTTNQKPLDLIVVATQRPRYYFPYPSLFNGEDDLLLESEFVALNELRDAATSLVTRAMWHAGERRHEQAWQDLLATHRLGRLIGQGPSAVEQLVAVAVDSIARDATLALLTKPTLPVELARRIQLDLASLENFDFLAKTLNGSERLLYVDTITQIAQRKRTDWLDEAKVDLSLLNHFSIDWNVSLRKGNDLYDRMTAAAQLSNHADRRLALSELESEIDDIKSHIFHTGEGILTAAFSSARRSEGVAQIMLALFCPPAKAFCNAEERTNSLLEMERIAAALAQYRIEHGSYPDRLGQLVPGVAETIPVDLFNAEPFQYRRIEDGFLLYSKGVNAQDDGGSNEQMSTLDGRELDGVDPEADDVLRAKIPADADDFSIRLPVPPFKLPQPPAAESAAAQ